MFMNGYYNSFVDPHSIPLSIPPLTQTGLDIMQITNSSGVTTRSIPLADDSLKLNGNVFSISLNLGDLLASSGKGVYTISVSGQSITGNAYFLSNLLTYTIFVD